MRNILITVFVFVLGLNACQQKSGNEDTRNEVQYYEKEFDIHRFYNEPEKYSNINDIDNLRELRSAFYGNLNTDLNIQIHDQIDSNYRLQYRDTSKRRVDYIFNEQNKFSLFFELIGGKWMLVDVKEDLKFQKDDFYDFLVKFTEDEEFRLNNVKFPLRHDTLMWDDEITDYVLNGFELNKEMAMNNVFFKSLGREWFRETMLMRRQTFDNFEGRFKNDSLRVVLLHGWEHGQIELYYFEKANGKWKLFHIVDYSV